MFTSFVKIIKKINTKINKIVIAQIFIKHYIIQRFQSSLGPFLNYQSILTSQLYS